MFDWNDLRYFLELQRSGRLLTAARRLNTTHATVARHIEAIEKSLGTALFVQHAQGYELTPAGETLLKHAEAMENVALLAQEDITQSSAPLGKIRLGVTEGWASCSSPVAWTGCSSAIRGWKWNWWQCRDLSASSTVRRKSASTSNARRPTCWSPANSPTTAWRCTPARPTWTARQRCAAARTWPVMPGSAMSTTCCSARN